jgi:sugar porter (SP) family MFS transporter
VIGILLAQVVNFLIADQVPAGASDSMILMSWNGQTGWRLMFQAVAAPALLFLVLAFFIPESPRFLAKLGKWDQAERILERIGGKQFALQGRAEIAQTLTESGTKVNVRELLAPGIKPLISLGVVLAVFQQWCGINVIFNYAEEIFSAAGYSVSDMLFNVVITGTINLIFTLVAMRMVDHWGRRNLMLTGSLGLAAVYLLLGAAYFFQVKGIAILVLVLVALATFAMTLGPVTWVILSEIFPNRIRGVAMATATTALWLACFILTYTFPILNKWLMASGTFWLYAMICLAGFVFILKKVPETKGKSLEEIEIKLTGK